MRRHTALLAAAAVATLPLAAFAQNASPSAAPPAGSAAGDRLTKADRGFVRKAVEGNLAEINLSQLALQKTQNPEIKDFAQKMVDDHTKANEQLTGLAAKDGIRVPAEPSRRHRALSNKLAKLAPADFDRAYGRAMVRDHDTAVKEFKEEAARGKNTEIVAWANATLPTIEDHDRMAHQLRAGGPSAER